MKNLITLLAVLLLLLDVAQGNSCYMQPGYSGTYRVNTGEVTLTLEITQDGFDVRFAVKVVEEA